MVDRTVNPPIRAGYVSSQGDGWLRREREKKKNLGAEFCFVSDVGYIIIRGVVFIGWIRSLVQCPDSGYTYHWISVAVCHQLDCQDDRHVVEMGT